MKNILVCFLSLSVVISFAQGEATKWYFGTFAHLDFGGGSPVVGSGPMTTTEGTASIADPGGTLLFYTNGVDVYDNTNTVMANGSGLMGDVSTTQAAMIVPMPGSLNFYYLFCVAPDGGPNGLTYSIVDMTLNSGLGDVTATKNVNLTDSVSEKICAIKNFDGDYWIVVHKWGDNAFYAYEITSTGISAPVISHTGIVHTTTTFQNTYGQMKFNLCGDKIGLAMGYMDTVELCDFDKTTGVVSNPITLPHPDHVYGIEFSPLSQFLYTTCYDAGATLAQFDISSGVQATILASKTVLSTTADLYGMQTGPDKKIYVSRSFTSTYLGRIADPDSAGALCNYTDNAIDLDPLAMGNSGALSLPSFPQNFLANNIFCPGPPSEIVESTAARLFSILPNPASGAFTLKFSGFTDQVSLTEVGGKCIWTAENVNGEIFPDEQIPAGIYFLSISAGNHTEFQKLIRY